MGVRGTDDLQSGGLVASVAGPEVSIVSSERRTRRQRHPRGGIEQRSESGGGLWGTVLTLVGIPVGWLASVVSAMIVLTHFLRPDAPITLVSGIGPTTTLYVAGGVLVIVGFGILVKPTTILVGWLLMGALVAAAATFVVGWTTLLVVLEALTIPFLVPAFYFKLIEDVPDGFLAALALERWLR